MSFKMYDLEQFKVKLLKIYSDETLHDDYKKNWSKSNPTYGQCVVTALLIQELFGGEIYKLEKENHYYNLIDGEVVDLTKEQFDYPLNYNGGIMRTKAFDEATMLRYEKLKKLLNISNSLR